MHKHFKILIYITLSSMFFIACAPQYSGKVPPKVINGEIDLTGWDFEKGGPVNLDGDWLFAWEKFVEPTSWAELQQQMVHTLPVPGYWNTLADPANPKQKLPGTGYASYAVRLVGLKSQAEVGVAVANQTSASKAYWLTEQGALLQSKGTGEIGIEKQAEIPKTHSATYYSPSYVVSENVVILLQVSNHHYFKGGPKRSISLGLIETLHADMAREGQLQDVMTGILIILGVYHLIIFFLNKKDKPAIFFGLFCVSMALRLFSMGVAQRAGFADTVFAWELLAKLEYVTIPLIAISFIAYLFSMVPGKLTKLIFRYSYVAGLPLAFLAIVTSPLVFPAYLRIFQLYLVSGILLVNVALIVYSLQRNRDAIRLLLSFLLIALGTINDILYANGSINSTFLGPYTTILFLLLQAGFISYKNAKAYKTAEYFSEKLSEEVDLQTARHIRIQDLTKEIQNSTSLDDFYQALKMTLRFMYKIKNFGLLMVSPDGKSLELFDLSTAKKIAEKDPFKKRKIDLTHPGSLHGKVLQKKKSYVFKRVRSGDQLEENEQAIIQKFNMTALYLLPLVVADQVFAMFSIFDTKDDELSYVANLMPYEREELEQLSSLISAGLFQHLQKEKIEKAQAQLEKQTTKLNRIQYLSQKVQNTSDLDTMFQNLNQVLVSEFNIPGYNLFLLNKEENQLESIKFETNYKLPGKIRDAIFQTPIDLSHPKSLHRGLVKKEKPYFLSRLLDVENAPDEMQYRELLGMKSLFFIPLKIDGVVFAFLSMLDTKFQEQDRIRYLTKDERKDIEQLSQFVSSALYQALQKEQIEKAQAAASRAKNEAAINQLAAHLAHEVNNPLNYIATGKTMQSDSFSKYHEMILGVLTGDDRDSLAFKDELEKLQDKFNRGLEQTNEGQDRIAKVIAEIRAITGVDGLNFTNFDIVPIINEEMVYSLHRNQVKIGEQAIKVTGTDNPIEVLSNQHILARSIRTVISNCIHFAREHKGNEGELYIDCRIDDNMLLMEIGNNSFSIKTKTVEDMFDLEKSEAHGTEQIGMAMIKELLQKINCDLVLADHGRESGKVIFQLQVPTNG